MTLFLISLENVSKEHLKIPKRYSEAVVFENCLTDYIFFYDKGPLYCASVIIAYNAELPPLLKIVQ
jgi:hypothetical protein